MGTERCSLGTSRAGLATERRVDGRGRPWRDTRAVLSGVLWILGTGAQWRELPDRYPPFQTCHRRFQQWVRSGKLEKALRLLAKHLHDRGKLDLQEAFIDATFASAKKGVLRLARHAEARGQRFSLSPLITVFHSQFCSERFSARVTTGGRGSGRKLPR